MHEELDTVTTLIGKKLCLIAVALCVLFLGTAVASLEVKQDCYCDREEVRSFIKELVRDHDLNQAELLEMFTQAQRQQEVLDAISKPAEKELTWAQYKPIFVTDSRAELGVKFWQENAEILSQVEKRFGVPPEIIVSVIGVETRYGTSKGKYPIFDSLVTLGFDGEARTGFFKKELKEFLLLARDEQFDPLLPKGSYAGAMGIPQFISSSYRMYAIDFDGDNRRDLFSNPADAIGSVANYFNRHGWRAGKAISVPVIMKGRKAKKIAVGRGRKGLKPTLTAGQLRKAGIIFKHKVSSDRLVVLLELEGEEGVEYWAGFKNFYVITRYNISAMYAMAVYQLSQRIKQQYMAASAQNISEANK